MKKAFVAMLMVAAVASSSFAAAYTTSFEYADDTEMLAGLAADGWTQNYNPNLSTTIVHSGNSALRLAPRVMLERPLGEFGTLTVWVYDNGLVPTTDANGYRWGISKGTEAVAGCFYSRSYLGCDVAYAVNLGFSNQTLTSSWWSAWHLDAGDPAARSRGVAGWMQWEIGYYPDGNIRINLLEDPNYPGFPKAFADNDYSVNEGLAAPDVNSVEFNNPATGGADAIYLYGSRDVDPLTFGDMYVDDLTWTPFEANTNKPGDANLDGKVDLEDFVLLKSNFGTGSTWGEGDFNGDGAVDLADFVILKTNFGS